MIYWFSSEWIKAIQIWDNYVSHLILLGQGTEIRVPYCTWDAW